MDAKEIAEQYLDVLEVIRNLKEMRRDIKQVNARKDYLYREMLGSVDKTDVEYPVGKKLALDILDGKVRHEENV